MEHRLDTEHVRGLAIKIAQMAKAECDNPRVFLIALAIASGTLIKAAWSGEAKIGVLKAHLENILDIVEELDNARLN